MDTWYCCNRRNLTLPGSECTHNDTGTLNFSLLPSSCNATYIHLPWNGQPLLSTVLKNKINIKKHYKQNNGVIYLDTLMLSAKRIRQQTSWTRKQAPRASNHDEEKAHKIIGVNRTTHFTMAHPAHRRMFIFGPSISARSPAMPTEKRFKFGWQGGGGQRKTVLVLPQEVQNPPRILRDMPRGFLCALFFMNVRSFEMCLFQAFPCQSKKGSGKKTVGRGKRGAR